MVNNSSQHYPNGFIIWTDKFIFDVDDVRARLLYGDGGQLILSDTAAHILYQEDELTLTGDSGLKYTKNESFLQFDTSSFNATLEDEAIFNFRNSFEANSWFRYSVHTGFYFSPTLTSFHYSRFQQNGLFLGPAQNVLSFNPYNYFSIAENNAFIVINSGDTFLELDPSQVTLTRSLGNEELILSGNRAVLKKDTNNYVLVDSLNDIKLKSERSVIIDSTALVVKGATEFVVSGAVQLGTVLTFDVIPTTKPSLGAGQIQMYTSGGNTYLAGSSDGITTGSIQFT